MILSQSLWLFPGFMNCMNIKYTYISTFSCFVVVDVNIFSCSKSLFLSPRVIFGSIFLAVSCLLCGDSGEVLCV